MTSTDKKEQTTKFPVDVSIERSILDDGFAKHQNDKKQYPLLGAIDQGTSSTRFVLFTPHGQIAASAQVEHTQIFLSGEDKVGWHEHDPIEIWTNTVACIEAVCKEIDFNKFPLLSIGITNQRETTVCWNKATGVPYYNAIVWDDIRTSAIVNELSSKTKTDKGIDRFRKETGLPLATYFAGMKVKWLLDNVPTIVEDINDPNQNVCFGTIDTWLMYQLTGTARAQTSSGANTNCKGIFITDVSNASRWLFMDLQSCQWDINLIHSICAPHAVPLECFPKILPSSHVYGKVTSTAIPCVEDIPIASILGDQQAALFGQCAFKVGQAKCTYGTGLFLLENTGTKLVPSTNGLLTTVAYQLGVDGDIHYALEGSVSHSGSVIQWLRDQVGLLTKASDTEKIIAETNASSNDGLYFVPAFAGLFAPYWRNDARGCIVGMTATHHKGHIIRAALEATAYQAREVFDAIKADTGFALETLYVDGGATANNLLMQFQADILSIPVVKPEVLETTSIGAAYCAGLAVGYFQSLEQIQQLFKINTTFKPKMPEVDRAKNWRLWKKAVTKSFKWIDNDESCTSNDAEKSSNEESDGQYNTAAMMIVAGAALVAGYLLGSNRRN